MCLDPDLKGTSPGHEGLRVEVEAVSLQRADAWAVQMAFGGVLCSRVFSETAPGMHAASFRMGQGDGPAKYPSLLRGSGKQLQQLGQGGRKTGM